jgi:hypothetical protein
VNASTATTLPAAQASTRLGQLPFTYSDSCWWARCNNIEIDGQVWNVMATLDAARNVSLYLYDNEGDCNIHSHTGYAPTFTIESAIRLILARRELHARPSV